MFMALGGDDAETPAHLCQIMAEMATRLAQDQMPKMRRDGAWSRLTPVWGDGWFGIRWVDRHTWYQERGIRAFTMHSLAGRVVPMWIDDPTGQERQNNPRAQTRMTESGKQQVLIFRRVGRRGDAKRVIRDGQSQWVPETNYPGAPGRIERREASAPRTTVGRVGGRVARGNVGVKWRHPGLARKGFMEFALRQTAEDFAMTPGDIFISGPRGRRL